MNERTIDELTTPYLWFSRSSCFNDPNDANMKAFIDNSNIVKDALKRYLNDQGFNEFIQLMNCTGICCFTKELPTKEEKKIFPKGYKSICIEYDKEILEQYFLKSSYAIEDCFKNVIYAEDPLKIIDDGEYHILASEDINGKRYDSLLTLTQNEKEMERLITLLLTRISDNYKDQKEIRIILGGRNIPDFNPSTKGYKVPIPMASIINVFLYGESQCVLLYQDTLKKLPIGEKVHLI